MKKEASTAPPTIVLNKVSKHFGGSKALDEASLTIRQHEVHGLLGENGSGKSTLIKVLSGFHAPDAGKMKMNDFDIPLPMAPGAARKLGIGFVHQDLGLVPSLSVLDNLRVGAYGSHNTWLMRWALERRSAERLLDEYGLHVKVDRKVAELTPTERAMLAIVRAMQDIKSAIGERGGKGLLVLDETTVFLPQQEKRHLFDVVRDISKDDASVLYVSHDLDEVLEITDRVTVLRDGQVQGTVPTHTVSTGDLIEMILGGAVEFATADRSASHAEGPNSIKIADLEVGNNTFPDIDLAEGEIVGLVGLPGTGFDDVVGALFGVHPPTRGSLSMGGTTHDLQSWTPAKAMRAGVGLLPGDRPAQGCILTLPVEENTAAVVLERYRGPFGLNRRKITADTRELLDRYDVRPRRPDVPIRALSGGNQQKALLGKWLQLDMKLWLLDEPTQGVDIGARQQIIRSIKSAADQGLTVLCASNDHEQLAVLCDRILVFGSGGDITELPTDHQTKQGISRACFAAVDPDKAVRKVDSE